MRRLFLASVLAIAAGFGLAPTTADAQWARPIYVNPYYPAPTVYVPSYPYYVNPYLAPVPAPYVWSSQYYSTPYQRGWYRDQYYPYSNTYFYQYRVRPNYYGPWWR